MRIRLARVEDCAGLAHIQVDSYRSAYAGLLPAPYLAHFSYEEQEQDWRDLLSAPTGDLVLVAETETGELAGYALGRPEAERTDYDGELAALHVRRNWQRRGIGRRLMVTMAGQLHGQGCTSLMLWVMAGSPARGFYEKLGGQPAGQKCWRIDEFDLDVVEVAYGWREIEVLESA
jgi:GNAT superfamily N-acetyltransferase